MKKFIFSGLVMAVAAFFGVLGFAPSTAFARSTAVAEVGQTQKGPQVKLPSNSGMPPYKQAEVFLGTISKQNGHYVLTAGQMTYKLNDPAKVKKYNGEQVQITGKLNPKTNKIQVLKIKKPSY